jgi:hypothetical protein
MKRLPNKQTATKPMTAARRDNLEIAEWARTCGRDVTEDELRCLRSLKRGRRTLIRLREVYQRMKQGGLTAADERWLSPSLARLKP